MTPKERKDFKETTTAIRSEQIAKPRAAPRQTINDRSRVRPIQELAINKAIRKETVLPIVRKQNVAGNNMNF